MGTFLIHLRVLVYEWRFPMNCEVLKERLDDYLDGLTGSAEAIAVERHAAACPACRGLLARETMILAELRRLPAPEVSEAFIDRAIARAVAESRPQRPWRLPALALAASLMVIIAVNFLLSPGTAPVQQGIPGLAIALNQTQEVSLVFESEHAMHNARFTIQLPEGLELSGYPGQREISWEGNLAQGKNLLVLPIEARSGHGGELIAHVTHTGKRKDFVLKMDVLPPQEAPLTRMETHAAPITVM